LLRERWQVVEAGAVLKRNVEFSESGEVVYSVTQTFDSVAGPG
jgi:hypothetical protein